MSNKSNSATIRFLAQPADVNFGGNVHGGTAMKWLDQAGYVCATGWSGKYCVTAFVGDINFHKPIPVGSLVEAIATIIHTGTSTMHISVDVQACDPKIGVQLESIHCMMVFVAVDENGVPVPVPTWTPKTDAEKSMEEYAKRIKEVRKINQVELSKLRA